MKKKLQKKIKICLLLFFLIIGIVIIWYKNYMQLGFTPNVTVSLYDDIKIFNEVDMNISSMYDTNSYAYTPFSSRVLSLNLKDQNQNLHIIELSNVNNTTSIQIDYDKNSIPSVVEIAIESKTGDFYYWDYILEDQEYLNFILPPPVLETEDTYYIQINVIWNKLNKIIGTKKYNFNINT